MPSGSPGDEQGLNQFPTKVHGKYRRFSGLPGGWPTRSEPVYWVLDETSFPKAGEHSVGWRGNTAGRSGDRQLPSGVSLHWSQSE